MLNGSGKKRENSWERVKSCRWSQSKNAAGIVEITADGMQWTSLKEHGLLLVLTLLTGTPHWFRASEEQNAITTNSAALPSHQTYPAGCQSRPSKFCAEPEPSMSYLFFKSPFRPHFFHVHRPLPARMPLSNDSELQMCDDLRPGSPMGFTRLSMPDLWWWFLRSRTEPSFFLPAAENMLGT